MDSDNLYLYLILVPCIAVAARIILYIILRVTVSKPKKMKKPFTGEPKYSFSEFSPKELERTIRKKQKKISKKLFYTWR